MKILYLDKLLGNGKNDLTIKLYFTRFLNCWKTYEHSFYYNLLLVTTGTQTTTNPSSKSVWRCDRLPSVIVTKRAINVCTGVQPYNVHVDKYVRSVWRIRALFTNQSHHFLQSKSRSIWLSDDSKKYINTSITNRQ